MNIVAFENNPNLKEVTVSCDFLYTPFDDISQSHLTKIAMLVNDAMQGVPQRSIRLTQANSEVRKDVALISLKQLLGFFEKANETDYVMAGAYCENRDMCIIMHEGSKLLVNFMGVGRVMTRVLKDAINELKED